MGFLHTRKSEDSYGDQATGLDTDSETELWIPGRFDQRHNAQAVLNHRLGNFWIGSRARLSSGVPVRTPDGVYFDADRGRYLPEQWTLDADRTNMFFQWDVRVQRTWLLSGFRLDGFLELNNILGTRSQEGRRYNFDISQECRRPGTRGVAQPWLAGDFLMRLFTKNRRAKFRDQGLGLTRIKMFGNSVGKIPGQATVTIALFIMVIAATGGCGTDFESPSVISSPRVLAVAAEPAETLVDDWNQLLTTGTLTPSNELSQPAAASAPVSVLSVVMTPLLVRPGAEDTPVTTRYRICDTPRAAPRSPSRRPTPPFVPQTAFVDAFTCGPEDVFTPPVLAAGSPGALAPTLEIPVDVPLADVSAAAAVTDASATTGLAIPVELEIDVGGQTLRVRKRVVFTPRRSPAQTPNNNPILTRLGFREERQDPLVTISPAFPPSIRSSKPCCWIPPTGTAVAPSPSPIPRLLLTKPRMLGCH